MQTIHWIQFGILAVGIMLIAWALSRNDPYGGAGADGAIGEAMLALIAMALGVVLIVGDALWFVIGGILSK